MNTSFELDESKNLKNLRKHGVDFAAAQFAFIDSKRVFAKDLTHSKKEKRYFCFGVSR